MLHGRERNMSMMMLGTCISQAATTAPQQAR
jgi:hypothetical protein